MCSEGQKAVRASMRAQWMRRYPGYCRRCEGHGGTTSEYDPSPAGVSLAPGFMIDWSPCPDCIEQNKCPRCGCPLPTTHHVLDGENWRGEPYHSEWNECDLDAPCPECGLCVNADDKDPLPEKWECYCEPDESWWTEGRAALDETWYGEMSNSCYMPPPD